MDDNVRTKLLAKRLYEEEQRARCLRLLVAVLVLLFILDLAQMMTVLDLLGRVCIGILPFLVIGGVVGFLALCFSAELTGAILLCLQDEQEAIFGYWGGEAQPARPALPFYGMSHIHQQKRTQTREN